LVRGTPDGPIIVRIGNADYLVSRLQPDPDVASKAFRLVKQSGNREVYDVYLDRYGPHCDCLGYLRWSKPCKHIRSLKEAGIL
jgi:hypothetical protein